MHGLERKALEGKRLEQLGRRAGLRKHEFQLVAGSYSKLGTGLGADANPVQSTRRLDGAVRFHRDRKSARMQRLDQRIVYLQQRLTAGENDKAILSRCSPFGLDLIRKLCRRRVAASTRAIRTHKLGIAERTLRG